MEDQPAHINEDLIPLLNQRNSQAFEIFYLHYLDHVFYYARRFLSSDADAEDITSEVFQKLWSKPLQFDSVSHLRAYMYTVTRNACLNHLKLAERRSIRETAPHLAQEENTDAFAEHEYQAELMKRIAVALTLLPAQTARIFKLSFVEDKTNTQIADLLSIHEHTVRNQKSAALKLLRRVIRSVVSFTLLG